METIFHNQLSKANIYEQWCRFQHGDPVDQSLVRPEIYQSWLRCRAARVDPFQPIQKELDSAAFAIIQSRSKGLIESAAAIMDNVFCVLTASRSIMTLASGEGVVLRALPCQEEPRPRPGSQVLEQYTGTAGIATCLVEKQAVEIFAAEHYCAGHHDWVCAAAPIFNRKGSLEGVLGITSPCATFHPHTSGMLGTAVRAIAEQLHLRELLGEQKTLMELLDEGVLVLDADFTVRSINAKACHILGQDSPILNSNLLNLGLFSSSVDQRLRTITPIIDEECTLRMQGGSMRNCVLSAAPNAATKGMVLTLRETSRMREFATRITGAKATYTFEDLVGVSAPMQDAVDQARKASASNITMLIQGESGTGKELFAHSIHNASPRNQKAFIVVNCGALPRELVQSELFGYSEGSFTGASKSGKPGKFELADGGTLFLDEIGEMPMEAQVNLLRLLQNGEVTRIGGKTTRNVDVRVIAATNRHLEDAVKQNAFRGDLYYRLNVFPLFIPPLRQRREDLPMLCMYFLQKFAKALKKDVKSFSPQAMRLISDYAWPGNVRELENAMERAVHMSANEEIGCHDLPLALAALPERVPQLERNADLYDALRRHRGNLRAVAQTLGISRSALYYKVRSLNIDVNAFRSSSIRI